MSKGTQDVTDLKTDITSPTSKDYREDTSNSGVYEYNSSVFGESSDASNANKIYYYRGILEPEEDQGQYGSDGQATTYPNYVKLDNDTCWRIVRTTGSGGVKMLYNGTWTGSTCANSQGETTTGSSAFDGYHGSNRQIVRVGYTYDTIYSSSYTKYFTMAELFGTNTTDNNSHSSDIKTETEAWYMRNISGYTSILEPSAGYCGDRTMYGIDYVLQPESISLPQYSRSTTSYYFGALVRNYTDAQLPSLTCAKFNDGTISVDRSKVDLYTVEGVSAGNNRLSQPIALLTADEATFAGSGKSASSSEGRPTYNIKSYMNTGTGFYLLSPYNRNSYGETHHFYLEPQSGRLSILYTNGIDSVRPVISLNSGITASAGSGIATDPWVVTAP